MLGIEVLEPSREGVMSIRNNNNISICSVPSRGQAPTRNPADTHIAFDNNNPERCLGMLCRPEELDHWDVGLKPSHQCPSMSSDKLLNIILQTAPGPPPAKWKGQD